MGRMLYVESYYEDIVDLNGSSAIAGSCVLISQPSFIYANHVAIVLTIPIASSVGRWSATMPQAHYPAML
jgi:hypothetical protein